MRPQVLAKPFRAARNEPHGQTQIAEANLMEERYSGKKRASIRRVRDCCARCSGMRSHPFAMVAGKTEPGQVESADEAVLGDFFRRQDPAGFTSDFADERFHGLPVIVSSGEDLASELAPMMKAFSIVGDVA